MTKDAIWFSSGSYDLRTGNIMEIVVAAWTIAFFDFMNGIVPQDSCLSHRASPAVNEATNDL